MTRMPPDRPRAILLAAALLVLPAGAALAQEAAEEKPAEAQAAPSESDEFDEARDVRRQGNTEGIASQKRIDEISDATETLFSRYSNTLRQIDSIRVYNNQMRQLIASQEAELTSLKDQLDRVEEVGRSVTPLMLRMIAAIEAFVELDVPFLIDERTERIENLRKLMARADVSNAEKYRGIMEAYQIENEYGRTIEAYRSTHTSEGREITVDFLRFGRIALVYQSLDEQESGVWNQEKRAWEPLDSSFRSAIRQGLRIARKQAAPDLVKLPLPAPSAAGGAS